MSRSGVIRQAIGPARTRLLGYVDTATNNYADQLIGGLSLDDCQNLSDDISEMSAKIKTSVSAIGERDTQWQALILSLDDNKVAAEEAIYSGSALDPATGFLHVVDNAKELLCRLDRKRVEADRRISSLTAANPPVAAVAGDGRVLSSSAKLPKLTLPTFSGDYLEWPTFWDIFKINVHDQKMCGAEKFAYLRAQLSGSARHAIDGLGVSDANYDTAVLILRERFQRSPSQLVATLYGQLKRLRPAVKSVTSLLDTYDSLEKIFRQLDGVGEAVDANRSLALDVLGKYPPTVVEDLMERYNVGPDSSLKDIREATRKYIRKTEDIAGMLEELQPGLSSRAKPEPGRKPASIQRSDESNISHTLTSAFTAASAQSSNQQSPGTAVPRSPCLFCNGHHFNGDCTAYSTMETRRSRLQELQRCFRCLRTDHQQKHCTTDKTRIRCFFCKAVGQHPTPLCPHQLSSKPPSGGAQHLSGNATSSQHSTLLNITEQALLLTATTTVINTATRASVTARVIFDTGSHRSYITSSCAKGMQLEYLHNEALHVSIFGTKRSLSVASQLVGLGIMQRDGSTRNIIAHTVPLITDCHISPTRLPPDDVSHLKSMQLDLADNFGSSNGSIDILVGSDYFWEFVTGSRVETKSGLYLIPSTLGLLVGGRYNEVEGSGGAPQPTLLCLTETYGHTPLEGGLPMTTTKLPEYPDVDEYWCLERIGISDDPVVNDDDRALEQFNKSVFHDGERYQVGWPWKSNCVNLPPNVELAVGRCKSLAKRLDTADPEILAKYQEVIDNQLAKEVIERVPDNEIDVRTCNHPVHYLPHHPVVRPSSTTTKIRIVYDASSKTRKDSPSLNDCLYRGPVILPDLGAILIRFRTHAIALVADVEKAFLQMGLQMPDRDVTRFLWFDSDGKLIHLRFRRVPFGVVSSPFLLGAVIQYHLRRRNNWVAQLMLPNIYVDNVICGAKDIDHAKEVFAEGKDTFRAAGMNLQQWCSSSDELMSQLPDDDVVKSRNIKLLGMEWDSQKDTLCLRNNFDASTALKCRTKRAALQAIASIYDPLGLFQPVLLRAKCFVQKLWADGKSWDEDFGSDLQTEWRTIYGEISPIFEHRIARHPTALSADNTTSVVVFCDASKVAYAATAYVRAWDGVAGTWATTLVCAKSRLAPKTKSQTEITMPRLELLGLTIGARLARFVRDALMCKQSPNVYLFTDSMCVLHWVHTAKPLAVFVDNRVREVNKLDAAKVMYVRTDDNPADINTRGKTAFELQSCDLWWRGPAWLGQPQELWPGHDVSSSVVDEPTSEMASEYKKSVPADAIFLVGEGVEDVMPFTIDSSKFSSFRKLQHVTAWCLRFIKLKVWDRLSDDTRANVRCNVRDMFEGVGDKQLTRKEVCSAKRIWVAHVQRINYGELMDAVQSGTPHHLIKQLGVGLDDDGILRCYGRFERANLTTDAIQPKLLAKNDGVTDLVIRDIHERLFHAGVGHTLSQVRREFWVPHGRNAVRKIITRCIVCRKHKGGPFALPAMPPWPRERLSRSSPFRYTGLDYFGPITVKIGETAQKMWVCLFTCLAVRAVHLEWVGDCTAKEFLECLIRFVSRRGTPDQIISDNAPQFRVTKTALDKIWSHVLHDDTILSYAATTGIQWKFTTELAPWKGGFYERLIGVVKGSFKAAVGRRMLPWGEFVTLCTEVEAVANSRPITYVYGDLQSGPALRPIDFLTDLSVGLPVSEATMPLDGLGDAGRNLIRYWKLKQGRLNSLRKFWYDEYLLSLRERGQTNHRSCKGEVQSSPRVNQVVLVKDTDAPRGAWKLAKVMRIMPSSDGAVRSVEVLLPNKVILRRAINHLYPLEIESTPNADRFDDNDDFDGFTEAEVDEAERRVQSNAVVVREAIRDNLNTVAFAVEL